MNKRYTKKWFFSGTRIYDGEDQLSDEEIIERLNTLDGMLLTGEELELIIYHLPRYHDELHDKLGRKFVGR